MRERSRAVRRAPRVAAVPHDERLRDIGLIMGFTGLALGMFSLGRTTAPGASCCDDLEKRTVELTLCHVKAGSPLT